mmetsp:Transcript_1020/g.1008  ORF Transcript_1020/g.1008 Transcript_1020/m.1008 type:complete len:119 (+) Transcript_1020:106-462(+)
MENHRDKHEMREHLMRGEGFKDLNYKYGVDYDYFEEVHREQSHKYNKYRERYYEGYWDTKENHEYYSKPLSERTWLQFKKIVKNKSLESLNYNNHYDRNIASEFRSDNLEAKEEKSSK